VKFLFGYFGWQVFIVGILEKVDVAYVLLAFGDART
jgi:hypothetical protein